MRKCIAIAALSLVVALASGAQAQLLPQFPELLAYWDFDDIGDQANAVDRTPSAHVGILEGAAAYTADEGGWTGAAGDYAMVFGAGSTNAVRVADASFLNTGSNTVTYSFWQQLTDVASTSTFWAVSPSSSGSSRGAQAHVPWGNGTIFFDTAGCCGGGTERISSMVAGHDYVADWSHYAFVKNGDTKQVWVNGVLAFEGTNTSPLPTDFTELYIGSANGNNSVHGKVDDFAIYDVALDEAQIGLIVAGQPIICPDCIFIRGDFNEDGLVNEADFNIMAANLGAHYDRTVGHSDGDYDTDRDVDLDDFGKFKTNHPATFAAATGVPEPATLSLAALMLAGTLVAGRRGRPKRSC